jgi:hypothetical protein
MRHIWDSRSRRRHNRPGEVKDDLSKGLAKRLLSRARITCCSGEGSSFSSSAIVFAVYGEDRRRDRNQFNDCLESFSHRGARGYPRHLIVGNPGSAVPSNFAGGWGYVTKETRAPGRQFARGRNDAGHLAEFARNRSVGAGRITNPDGLIAGHIGYFGLQNGITIG